MDIRFTVSSTVVLVPAAAAWCGTVAAMAARRRPGWMGAHALLNLIAGAYALAVLGVTIFPIEVTIGRYGSISPWYDRASFIPVATIDAKTFLLNIFMTVPLGMLLPVLSRRVRSVRTVAVVAAAVSAVIEILQFGLNVFLNSGRTADVNDIIANTAGAVLGYYALRAAYALPAEGGTVRALARPGTVYATAAAPSPRPADVHPIRDHHRDTAAVYSSGRVYRSRHR
jgi:VanZ family protein